MTSNIGHTICQLSRELICYQMLCFSNKKKERFHHFFQEKKKGQICLLWMLSASSITKGSYQSQCSLQERQDLKCFAAFFTLSPLDFRNLSTQKHHCRTSPVNHHINMHAFTYFLMRFRSIKRTTSVDLVVGEYYQQGGRIGLTYFTVRGACFLRIWRTSSTLFLSSVCSFLPISCKRK